MYHTWSIWDRFLKHNVWAEMIPRGEYRIHSPLLAFFRIVLKSPYVRCELYRNTYYEKMVCRQICGVSMLRKYLLFFISILASERTSFDSEHE